jgi:hypothetical protein
MEKTANCDKEIEDSFFLFFNTGKLPIQLCTDDIVDNIKIRLENLFQTNINMKNIKDINVKDLNSNRLELMNVAHMNSDYGNNKGVFDERQDPSYGGKKNKKTNKYRYLYTKSKKRRSLKIRKSRIPRR